MNEAQAALIRVLADGAPHAGETLCAALELTPAELRRRLDELPRMGLELVPGAGYRLARPLCLLDAGDIRAAMDSADAPALIVLDQVDSTNAELKRRTGEDADPLVCLAEYQSAGRGRHRRGWVSPYSHGLCFSLRRRLTAPASTLGGLSLALGVAVRRALTDLGFADIMLKWPNDVLAQGRKLGGILIEIQACEVIAGIGLNWRVSAAQGCAIDQPWIDLAALGSGPPPNRNRVAGRLIEHALAAIEQFTASGLAPFLEEWRAADALLGRSVEVTVGDEEISGRGLGIDAGGLLLVATASGQRRITAGQVRVAAHAE